MIVKFCDFCGVKLNDLYQHCTITIDVGGVQVPRHLKYDSCDNCLEDIQTEIKKHIKKKT